MDCSELFDRVSQLLTTQDLEPAIQNKIMHETLVQTCTYGLKNCKYGFGDLNAQVEQLIQRHHISQTVANAIHKMRRDSNRSDALLPEELLHDAHALATFIAQVFDVDIPKGLTSKLPRNMNDSRGRNRANTPDKRCTVMAWDDTTIMVRVDEDDAREWKKVFYTKETQYANMQYLRDILRKHMQLNLIGCHVDGDAITPQLIVVEPDCLIDISSIAACFEDYGHHPLLYLVNRLKPRLVSQPILLGNFASNALDDIISNREADFASTLVKNFTKNAVEYSICQDFNATKFKQDAMTQMRNLKQIVAEIENRHNLKKAILEPSLICEKFGLQGRVDLMTTDLKLLVEQKSGRNIFLERGTKNQYGGQHIEKHYVQLLLYNSILYTISPNSKRDIQLLYSKFELPNGLIKVKNLMELFYKAIRFRNEAVALEFDIAHNGMRHILPTLSVDNLNTAGRQDFFYDRYLRPQLENTLLPLQQMQPLEHAYFCRMMQFVILESLLSKVGVCEGSGNSVANLWNMPLAEKKETGNIYTNLTVINKVKSGQPKGNDSYDLITLTIPEQDEGFLPNFRRGDMVWLYAYPQNEEPDIRKALVFKGGLADIHANKLTVKLSDGQQNKHIFDHLPYSDLTLSNEEDARPEQRFAWCIEHGNSDVGSSSAIRALYEFVTSADHRKALLLGQRKPRRDTSLTLSRSYDPILDPLLLKVKQAQDYFLLVGPPGTGKTSRALRFMVEEELANKSSAVLLLAYTNRAVDEICDMLVDAGIDFLRVGSELSCAPQFEAHLIPNAVGEKPLLNEMKATLASARVVVGTTATLQARPFIFGLKHFTMALVDESSQILEPNIIGLLAGHSGTTGKTASDICDIDKFVLVGDYKQLPAVVRQNDVQATVSEPELHEICLTNCKNSLFERLINIEKKSGRTAFMGVLQLQGRMHPDIAEFPTKEFYFDEQLRPVPLRHQLATTIDYKLPSEDSVDDMLKQHRVLFIASGFCRRPDISDKVNTIEAHIVADLLRRIHRFADTGFDPDKTVGVIVPYRNQIAMIRREIEKMGIADLEKISIDTVERYQGSQRDVIIYSFTIQQRYQLDFLTANVFEENGHTIDRKLNVALTRARKQLVLVGNPSILGENVVFKRIIDYSKQKKCYIREYKPTITEKII